MLCKEICFNGNLNIKCSTPQGSVLEPLLFIIYVYDLRIIGALESIKFADDKNLFLYHKGIKQLLNQNKTVNFDLVAGSR